MRPDRRSPGFTLIETLVSVLILSFVMIGLMSVLDSSNRIAKQETQVADAQAGSRSGIFEISKALRNTRTGLISPLVAVLPLVNNADASTPTLEDMNANDHTVRPGTDAVEVRGILNGSEYYFSSADLLCGGQQCQGTLTNSTNISVTIRKSFPTGETDPNTTPPQDVLVVNWLTGDTPPLAARNASFFFVVQTTQYQNADPAVPASPLVNFYTVGKVSVPSPPDSSWYTTSTDPSNPWFQFTMVVDPADAETMTLMGRTTGTPLPAPSNAIFGGDVDDVVFFIDRGPTDPTAGDAYTHPFLAQAIRSIRNPGQWDIQPLVEDVEDLQFAYGIDGADGNPPDRGIDPSPSGQSTTAFADEWVLNVAGEDVVTAGKVSIQPGQNSYPQFILTGAAPAFAVSALRAVYVGIVTKSFDPDFQFKGRASTGYKLFDSTAVPVLANSRYRRRVQTMSVFLRNYQ